MSKPTVLNPERLTSFITELRTKQLDAEPSLTSVDPMWRLAIYGHLPQVRKDGTPYVEHPLRMTRIAFDELGIASADVHIALLGHDLLDDSDLVTVEMLKRLFGTASARRLYDLADRNRPDEQHIADLMDRGDEITLLVKTIDRIDNLRTMTAFTADKKRQKVAETRCFYGPLIVRLINLTTQQTTPARKQAYHAQSLMVSAIDRLECQIDGMM